MGVSRRFAFRADGSKETGFGHLVRSAVLAASLEKKGHQVFFVTSRADESVESFFSGRGFKHIPLPSLPALSLAEAHIKLMKEAGAEVTVLDSYSVDDEYRSRLKEAGMKIAAIDDIYRHYSHADLAINHNPSAEAERYENFSGKLLCGTEYAIIDPAFAATPANPSRGIPRVLITMGGTDNLGQTERVVRLLDSVEEEIQIIVLAGFYNAMGKRQNLRHEYRLIDRPSLSMASILSQCDAAITAGGVTCMELACMGKPFLILLTDKYQLENAYRYEEAGAALYAGYANAISDEKLMGSIRTFLSIREDWAAMGDKGRRLVDGKGAERVATAIEALSG